MACTNLMGVGAAGLLLVAVGCAGPGAPDTRRELLAAWGTGIIIPQYASFEAQSEALSSALDQLCQSPTSESRQSARNAWMAARETWKEAEVYAFGPYSRPEFRIGPKIDSWPARNEDIEQLIAGDSPVDPSSVASLGVWHKGLPAIEYLLYPTTDAEPLALSEPRRCEYLSSLGAELVSRAREIHVAWSPEGADFAAQLSDAGRTSTAFRSLRDAFSEIVNRMGFTIQNIRRDKLGRPLGEASGGTPAPDSAESRFSGRSLADIQDNLDGIELLFYGDAGRNVPGLRQYLSERDRDFDDAMRSALDESRARLDAIGMPLTEAVQSSPDAVVQASEQLDELQSLIQVDIIGALGLTLNFNDNDGD
jgi:predicted lipoprotein